MHNHTKMEYIPQKSVELEKSRKITPIFLFEPEFFFTESEHKVSHLTALNKTSLFMLARQFFYWGFGARKSFSPENRAQFFFQKNPARPHPIIKW